MILKMKNSSICYINSSMEFFKTYNFTIQYVQPIVYGMTWATAIICLTAAIINAVFAASLPRLMKTGQLAFKRYAFIFNLSVSDLVGCSVVGIISSLRLAAGESLFGDLVKAKFDGMEAGIPTILVTSYAAQFVYTSICALQYLATCRPIYYSLHIRRKRVFKLCIYAWLGMLVISPTIILPVVLVDDCLLRVRCLYPLVLLRGIFKWEAALNLKMNRKLQIYREVGNVSKK